MRREAQATADYRAAVIVEGRADEMAIALAHRVSACLTSPDPTPCADESVIATLADAGQLDFYMSILYW